MARRAWVVGLLVAAVASCGGGDSVDPDEDEALIEDALLTLDDLPDGFREEPVDDDDENRAGDECNEEILDLDRNQVDDAKTAETYSVQFDSGELSLRAQITAFNDSDVPRRIIKAFEDDDDYVDCFIEGFTADVPDDITVEAVDIEVLPIKDDSVDAGVTLVVELDVAGVEAEARTFLALVDRYTVALDVTARAEDMDTDVAVDALDEMVFRLSDG